MRYGFAIALALMAGPAFAHHEVVMVTSFLPVIAGVATICAAGLVTLRNHLKQARALSQAQGSSRQTTHDQAS